MTVFYCVRHGKTEFNQNKVMQGGTVDSPLLPEGIESAKLVGGYLHDVPFKKVLVSPQTRAQDTAKILLAEHQDNLAIETIADLREMEFGTWDGQAESGLAHHPEFQDLVHRPHLYDPSSFGGESFAAMIERGKQVFIETAREHPDDHILIVSHGLFLQTLLKVFQGIPLAEVREGAFLDNTSVTTVRSTSDADRFEIVTWNDTSFIP